MSGLVAAPAQALAFRCRLSSRIANVEFGGAIGAKRSFGTSGVVATFAETFAFHGWG